MSPQEAARLVGHTPTQPDGKGFDGRALIAPAMFAAALFCLFMAWAVDARGEPRPYELVVLERPTADGIQDRQRVWVIATYPDRDACVVMLNSVKIRGAKARCQPKED